MSQTINVVVPAAKFENNDLQTSDTPDIEMMLEVGDIIYGMYEKYDEVNALERFTVRGIIGDDILVCNDMIHESVVHVNKDKTCAGFDGDYGDTKIVAISHEAYYSWAPSISATREIVDTAKSLLDESEPLHIKVNKLEDLMDRLRKVGYTK